MKSYEGMFLVDTKESKKSSDSVEEQIRNLIKKCGGQVSVFERWDDRKLAYEVKGTTNGTYYLLYFTGDHETVGKLNRECELSPVVLRAMFLRIKKIPDPLELKPEVMEEGGESSDLGSGKREPENAARSDALDEEADEGERADEPAAVAETAGSSEEPSDGGQAGEPEKEI